MSFTIVFASQSTFKIAVASDGKSITSNVGTLAGRSPYFFIFDSSGKLVEIVDNPYRDVRSGAGVSVVSFLTQKGVKTLVAGTFGVRMLSAMKAKDIKYIEFKGSVHEAVKKALSQK
ncbi:MAG: NifB/NifX family molybdenum-iron cluster-binding protein [Caldimicrobium sp.]